MKRIAGLLWTAALLTAACGGDGSEEGDAVPVTAGTDVTSGTDASGSPTSAAPPSTAGAPADPSGGVMRYAYRVDVTRFDPHRATSAYDNQFLNHSYDRLVHLDRDNELVPGLATEWTSSADGMELELTLREGVTFHDGATFDAEAVVANIERGQTLEGSTVAAELDGVERVEVVDDHFVRLHLSEPDSSLPAVLSDRPGMMISPAAFESADLDQQPVGTGMYTVTDYRVGDRVTYERFADYWDPDAAGLDRLQAVIIPEASTRLNALRSGEIDATEIDSQQVGEAEGAGLTVESGLTMEFFHVQMNRTASEFEDVRVRQALNMAVDREALIDAHGFGLGEATDQPFPPNYFAHAPDISPLFYEYDPEGARQLLAEAGLADGFEFEMMVPNFPERTLMAEILQSSYADIGVTLNVDVVEGVQLSERFYGDQVGDTILSRWTGRADPLQTMGLMYTPGAAQNPGGHTTEDVQAAYDDALATTDPEERVEAVQALTEQVVRDAMAVPLYIPSYNIAMNDRVRGLVPWLSGKPEFRGVGMAD